MSMRTDVFWKTVVVGLIATFTMTLTGFWQGGVGLARMDVGAMLAANMTAAHPDAPYSLTAGNLAHFALGVLMALAWVAFLKARIPGNWFVHGFVFAVLTATAAAGVIVPLVAGAGLFFSRAPAPGLMLLSDLVAHLGYAFPLMLGLELAGVRTARTQRDDVVVEARFAAPSGA